MSNQKNYRGMDEGNLPLQKKNDDADNLEYAKTKFLQQKLLFWVILGLIALAVLGFVIYLSCIVNHPDPTYGQLIVLGMLFSFTVLLVLSLVRFVFGDRTDKVQRHWLKSFFDECLHILRDYIKKV